MTCVAINSIERLAKSRIDPIHVGVNQFAELAYLFAQLQDVVYEPC
jgi:hypothetical protein